MPVQAPLELSVRIRSGEVKFALESAQDALLRRIHLSDLLVHGDYPSLPAAG